MVDHRALWIEINKNRLIGFWKHDIFPPAAWNLCLTYPRMIKKFNNTLHKIFVKHDIYQKIHYIHVGASYSLPINPAQDFEKLDELITRLMQKEMSGWVKWSLKYKEAMDLVEIWVLLKTRYKEHCYNSRRLTQPQRQFPWVTSNVNETEIITGLR